MCCYDCDRTNINVSSEEAIHYLKMLLGHSFHCFTCQVLGNELPFCAVFYEYFSKPSDPENWCGPTGKQIKELLAELTFVAFHAINFPVLNEKAEKDLSWDLKC